MRASVFVWLCALFAAAASESNETESMAYESAIDITCINHPFNLLGKGMTAKDQPTRVDYIFLHHCMSGLESYPEILKLFNIIIGDTLELRDIPKSYINYKAMIGGENVKKFIAINSGLYHLPVDLFKYSPNLTHIDLSGNFILYFPYGLFTKLPKLTTLILTNNQLRINSLGPLMPLTSLKELRINQNPITDHCHAEKHTSELAVLQNLEYLDMSETEMARVCDDWLPNMRRLTRFVFTHNSIESVSCSQLAVSASVNNSRIELNNNPLTHIECSSKDVLPDNSDNATAFTKMELWMDRPATCGCSLYWLIKTMHSRHVQVRMRNNEYDPCENRFRQCEAAH